MTNVSTINAALSELTSGRPVIINDDATARSALYVVQPAVSIAEQDICFMVVNCRGLVCAAEREERLKSLGIPLMPRRGNSGALEFTVSVEARHGVTTGISAADRAQTLRALAATEDSRLDLVMPGHIFPVAAKKGGLLVRLGPSEAVVDILAAAGLNTTGAFCLCLDETGAPLTEGQRASHPILFQLPLVSISEIVRMRLASETVVERFAESFLPTQSAGVFRAICFRSRLDTGEHLALIKGDIGGDSGQPLNEPILARVHAENRLGDLLDVKSAHTRSLILSALQEINRAGRGVFVYVRRPRRGLLEEQINQHTSPASPAKLTASQMREYGIGSQILSQLGVRKIRLLSNSMWEIPAVAAFNLEITEQVTFPAAVN